MEFRNTALPLSFVERKTGELLEDLCLALREVGVREREVIEQTERGIETVDKVKNIYTELSKRKIDFDKRIEKLPEETSWNMEEILDNSLAYPAKIPYVRENDNVRRYFRCQLCGKYEYPDRNGLFICDKCILDVSQSIQKRELLKGIVLFRTYNKNYRWRHADDDTVLADFDDAYEYFLSEGRCLICFQEEQIRRRNLYARNHQSTTEN